MSFTQRLFKYCVSKKLVETSTSFVWTTSQLVCMLHCCMYLIKYSVLCISDTQLAPYIYVESPLALKHVVLLSTVEMSWDLRVLAKDTCVSEIFQHWFEQLLSTVYLCVYFHVWWNSWVNTYCDIDIMLYDISVFTILQMCYTCRNNHDIYKYFQYKWLSGHNIYSRLFITEVNYVTRKNMCSFSLIIFNKI